MWYITTVSKFNKIFSSDAAGAKTLLRTMKRADL